nr:hypothetical protein [Nostoc sp. CHAB 5715]
MGASFKGSPISIAQLTRVIGASPTIVSLGIKSRSNRVKAWGYLAVILRRVSSKA